MLFFLPIYMCLYKLKFSATGLDRCVRFSKQMVTKSIIRILMKLFKVTYIHNLVE